MTFFLIILGLILLISFLADNNKNYENKSSLFITLIAALIASLLAGFRTSYNDTERYMYTFQYVIPNSFDKLIETIDWSLGSNPGFYIFQYLLKSFISESPQILILVSSLITFISIFLFVRKYSYSLAYTVFIIIASGLFMLGMAAIKQIMAIAIGIWAIPYFIEKKYLKMFFILFLAAIIHPFILLYLLVFFVSDDIWNKKIILAFILVFIIGILFKSFVGSLLSLAGTIGVNYDASYILEAKGMNILRVLVFSATPILTYIFRDEIRQFNSKILIISVNFSVIAFLFTIIASYGGANMFGRLASYFEIFNYLTLTFILFFIVSKNLGFIYRIISIGAYSFFFYYQTVIIKKFEYKSILDIGGLY